MPRPDAPSRKRVAVMQPYFLPYAGYFRLFAGVDEFGVLDCVPFPRRGRVHRTEVPDPKGDPSWLTLPLARQPREVLIRDLRFAPDARASFDARLAALPWFGRAVAPGAESVHARLRGPLEGVVDFLQDTLLLAAGLMGFQPAIRRSSTLCIDPALRGQARVIAIAAAVGATHYLNSPGGRGLYDATEFARHDLALEFLAPYRGAVTQLLPALLQQSPDRLRADVLTQLTIEPAEVQ